MAGPSFSAEIAFGSTWPVNVMAEAANMVLGMKAAAAAAGINPEIQSPQFDMQPPTVYPYHAMGSMAPMMYAPGNMLPGYNFPVMVNPEA